MSQDAQIKALVERSIPNAANHPREALGELVQNIQRTLARGCPCCGVPVAFDSRRIGQRPALIFKDTVARVVAAGVDSRIDTWDCMCIDCCDRLAPMAPRDFVAAAWPAPQN